MAPGSVTWATAAVAVGASYFGWHPRFPTGAGSFFESSIEPDDELADVDVGDLGDAEGIIGVGVLSLLASVGVILAVLLVVRYCWANAEVLFARLRQRKQLRIEANKHAKIANKLSVQADSSPRLGLQMRLKSAEHERDIYKAQAKALRDFLTERDDLDRTVTKLEAECARLREDSNNRKAAGLLGKCQRERARAVSLRKQVDADDTMVPELTEKLEEVKAERDTFENIMNVLQKKVITSEAQLPDLLRRQRIAEREVEYWKALISQGANIDDAVVTTDGAESSPTSPAAATSADTWSPSPVAAKDEHFNVLSPPAAAVTDDSIAC